MVDGRPGRQVMRLARHGDWLVRECRLYRQGAGWTWVWVVGLSLAVALPVYLLSGLRFLAAAPTGVAIVLLLTWGAARVVRRRRWSRPPLRKRAGRVAPGPSLSPWLKARTDGEGDRGTQPCRSP